MQLMSVRAGLMSVCLCQRLNRRTHDFTAARLPGRGTHHLESVHPSGVAVRICTIGSTILDQWIAVARRHGCDLRRYCHPGSRGRCVGSQGQSIRPSNGFAAADGLRRDLAVASFGRWVGATLCRTRQPIGAGGRDGDRHHSFAVAGSRYGSFMGALRRAHSRTGADGRSHFGS